jgi:hypothetical protein
MTVFPRIPCKYCQKPISKHNLSKHLRFHRKVGSYRVGSYQKVGSKVGSYRDPSRILPDPSRILPDPSRILPDTEHDPSRILPDPSRILPDKQDPSRILVGSYQKVGSEVGSYQVGSDKSDTETPSQNNQNVADQPQEAEKLDKIEYEEPNETEELPPLNLFETAQSYEDYRKTQEKAEQGIDSILSMLKNKWNDLANSDQTGSEGSKPWELTDSDIDALKNGIILMDEKYGFLQKGITWMPELVFGLALLGIAIKGFYLFQHKRQTRANTISRPSNEMLNQPTNQTQQEVQNPNYIDPQKLMQELNEKRLARGMRFDPGDLK